MVLFHHKKPFFTEGVFPKSMFVNLLELKRKNKFLKQIKGKLFSQSLFYR